jgi:hypothetical protein
MHRSLIATVAGLLLTTPVAGQQAPGMADQRIIAMVDAVSAERLGEQVRRLAGFETRHTLSAVDRTDRGIGAARQWIHDEFTRMSPRLQVSFDTYQVAQQGQRLTRDFELRNVMAVLPGRTARRVYISGHFDTVARVEGEGGFNWAVGDNPAPGANDDGSGTALVMELARVMAQSGVEFDATLVFIALAGEEQGLVGAALHAGKAARDSIRIDAVLNNDIIGGGLGGSGLANTRAVRLFSEGPEDSPSRQLARYIHRMASRYVPAHEVRLIARHDRFGRGGDHTAFNQFGFAGVRFSETHENDAKQHTIHDTVDGVDPEYLARNARVNVAAAAGLALAPPAPGPSASPQCRPSLGRGRSGYDATLRWCASPGAVAYRVVWRDTWDLDWQHERVVGSVTEFSLPNVSIDDFVFGVAAIGADGNESLVHAYVNPPRGTINIRERP